MEFMNKTIGIFILISFFLTASFMASGSLQTGCCAYLDPGTGSFIFQMLIAGFVGGLFALKLFWSHVKTFSSGLFSKRKKEDAPK